MPTLSEQFATIFRDFETDGVPASGEHEPKKPEIRALGAQIEDALIALEMAGVGVIRKTQAALYADLAHGVDTFALVLFDSTAAKNGFYVKVGASGTGSWTGPSALPTAILTDALAALDDAVDAKNLAAAWAEGTLPGGAGTKSAKEHALSAIGWAEGTLPGGAGTKSAKEHATDAAGSATTAGAAASTAGAAASTATAQAGIAATIKNDILAISGVKGVAATKSEALAALAAGSYANGTLVRVKADETKSGASWDYQVSGAAFVDKGAAITNGKITVPRNVTPATSSSTDIFEVIPDEPLTNSAGGNDAVISAMRQTTHYLTQGPTGHANYYNSVIGFGHNVNGSFAPLNTAQAAASSRIEFKFAQGGAGSFFGAEYHCASLLPAGGGELRAISAFIAHDKTKWHVSPDGSSVGFAAYSHVWRDGRNAPRIQYTFSDTTAAIFYTKGDQPGSFAPQIYFEDNDRPFLYLINAARSGYVAPFKLTAGDRMFFGNPETRQISGSAGALGFGTVGSETQYLSPTAGTTGQVVTWQDVTGDYTPEWWHGGISGRGVFLKRNTTSGGKFGQTWVSANGTMFISFEDTSVGGIPGFQIRQTAGAGTLVIDNGWRGEAGSTIMATFNRTSGVVEFPNGALLGLKTVGTLPTPTTGDKGRSFFCTNARNAGEGAGAGTGSIVACNGSAYTIPGIAGAVAA